MKLLLARHGNTFGPNDPVVWVGTGNDLPLVESGRAQAVKLGNYFAKHYPETAVLHTGTLARLRETASLIAQSFPRPLHVLTDSRLNEIDYGPWTGKSNAEIAQEFGSEQLTNWSEQSIWPTNLWPGSEAAVIHEVEQLANELNERYRDKTVVVISSNGRLRYFLKLVSGEFESRVQAKDFKMGTGCFGELSTMNDTARNDTARSWQIRSWNRNPAL